MQSWEEYFTKFLVTYRRHVDSLSKKMREEINKVYREFLKPCQIEVITFGETGKLVVISTNNEEKPDMKIVVHKMPKNIDVFMDDLLKRNPELEAQTEDIREALANVDNSKFTLFTPNSTFWSPKRLEDKSPEDFANDRIWSLANHMRFVFSRKQQEVIKKASQKLMEDIGKIPEIETKTRLSERVQRIEDALRKIRQYEGLDKKVTSIEGDIKGIRKLVGFSEEFQDWRLMVLDIDRLKQEHVPKDLFIGEINTLKARIDALSNIKKSYDTIFAQQNTFMKQQSEVMKQQSNLVNWIKYATILVPIAVVLVPVIEILLRHFLGIS